MRLRAGCVWMVIVALSVGGTAEARPSVGRAGGGGGGGGRPQAMARPTPRPQMPTPRPQMPQTRPQMPQARPQPQARPSMPQVRPQMPQTRPSPGGMGGVGGMPRPQTPQFQRPSVGSLQRPNPARPSLPNAMPRPQPQPTLPGGMSRPGLGGMRPGGGVGGQPGNAGLPNGSRPGVPMTKPAPQPGLNGLSGGGFGGGNASRPGGGFGNRPSFPPRPGQLGGGQLGGGNRPGGMGGVTTLPGNRPGLGPTTKPSFPTPSLPDGQGGGMAGGNRPGGGGNRPGLGGVNRPPPLPGDLGGNRPGSGNRPDLGGNRPTTLPGDLGGGNRPGGHRPGAGGNRPGIGGNRPTTLPGDLGHWHGGGNWNGGHDRPGRPGIGGNRPGIGDGNWNSGNFTGNNFNNINVGNNVNVGGGWNGGHWGYGGYGGGYGGWGYGGGYGGWNNGWVNPHYGNWYNGAWNGGWGGYNGGWWAPFAAGAATWGVLSTIGNWGLGYGTLGYGAAGYVNPYYASMPATVVAASPYDYSQPIVVNNYIPAESSAQDVGSAQVEQAPASTAAASPGDAAVDAALAKFKAGDYSGALAGFDQALKLSPKDSVIHEVRALALFALGRYPEAAAALNAVLASAPGMDWTTVSNVYGSVDAYTTHLRRLEDFCRSHPDDAAAHFVLAYHYLVGGYSDMAAAALRVVVAKQPGDVVARRMLEAIEPEKASAAPAPASSAEPATPKADLETPSQPSLPEIDLVGSWKATNGNDTIHLVISADSAFTWKAQPKDKPAVELAGTIETAADAIALVSKSAGTMVAKVTPKAADSFEFSLPSAPKDTKPLLFARQP